MVSRVSVSDDAPPDGVGTLALDSTTVAIDIADVAFF
jgi:hypothetical protein